MCIRDSDFGDLVFGFTFDFWWCPSLYLADLHQFYDYITYVIAFWCLSSHNEDIMEEKCPLFTFFENFEKFKMIFVFHLGFMWFLRRM